MPWMFTPNAHAPRHDTQDEAAGAYMVIVRGPDGRPRSERFDDAAAYRARLVSMRHSSDGSVSIEEIAGLLDT